MLARQETWDTLRVMALQNTPESYGSVARVLHWLTALLIFSLIPLGLLANRAPFTNDAEIAFKFWLFSMHKTLGVTLFTVALIRILWAVTQPKPEPLHPGRKAETFLADLVHWLLYGSLVLLPVTGWIEHASMPGYAPIWWPFGQSLPFVPDSYALGKACSALHRIFGKVLIGAILLHVAGAIKHQVIDRDATLRRMWSGRGDPVPVQNSAVGHLPAALCAVAVYGLAVAVGFGIGMFHY